MARVGTEWASPRKPGRCEAHTGKASGRNLNWKTVHPRVEEIGEVAMATITYSVHLEIGVAGDLG